MCLNFPSTSLCWYYHACRSDNYFMLYNLVWKWIWIHDQQKLLLEYTSWFHQRHNGGDLISFKPLLKVSTVSLSSNTACTIMSNLFFYFLSFHPRSRKKRVKLILIALIVVDVNSLIVIHANMMFVLWDLKWSYTCWLPIQKMPPEECKTDQENWYTDVWYEPI